MIGATFGSTRAPSSHLPAVERAASIEPRRMDEIFYSHCIAPGLLRADGNWQCYAPRAETLLQRIEAAIGKDITREAASFRAGVVTEAYGEGPEEESEDPLKGAVL